MANEISVQVVLNVANGNYKPGPWSESATFNQAIAGASAGILDTTVVMGNLDLGSVPSASMGYLMLKNIDTTNAIDFGLNQTGTFAPLITLGPGEVALFRLKPSVVPAAKAQAGTPGLQFWLLQN